MISEVNATTFKSSKVETDAIYRYLCSNEEIDMAKENPMFFYEETDEGKLEYFSKLSHLFTDWLTNPLKKLSIDLEAIEDYRDQMEAMEKVPDKEKIDFIDKDFKDAYLRENKRRRSWGGEWFWTTSLDCIYVKNTPENLKSIEYNKNKINRYRIEDDGTIFVADLGRWDRPVLNLEFYSKKVIAAYCRNLGIKKNDIDSERGVIWWG